MSINDDDNDDDDDDKLSRPDLFNVSMYEKDEYNSFKQRFLYSFSIFLHFLVKPECQIGHAYSRIERIIVL